MSIESPRSLDENLFSLFWDQAMAHPDRPAVAAPEGDIATGHWPPVPDTSRRSCWIEVCNPSNRSAY